MKKTELKRILKPLIKECIKEVIFEEGVLSGLISEVAQGMGSLRLEQSSIPKPQVDTAQERMRRNAFNKEKTQKLQEHRTKLMSAIGESTYNGVNLFEGTTPAAPAPAGASAASPLAGHPSSDPGVDISNLFGAVGKNWNVHMNGLKEGK